MATFNLKNRVRRKLQRIHGKVFLASFKGDEYYCNICDHSFNRMLYLHDGYTIRGAYSDHSMANAICPNCGSWFRHRMMKSYIEQNDFLSKGHEVLHFAPEEFFVPGFHALLGGGYNTCDLKKMTSPNHHIVNITDIQFEDHRFEFDCLDCLYCAFPDFYKF